MAQEQDKDFYIKAVDVWRTENLLGYILRDIETRAKKDVPVKVSVLCTAISSFLKSDPINLFLKGESSSGKTFNTVQVLKYFDESDIWFLGGMSPQALARDHGLLLNKNGEEIDIDARPVKPRRKGFDNEDDFNKAMENYTEDMKARREQLKDAYTLIDLSHKILVFLESPHIETFMMLRPILSHDKEEIEYRFAAKTSSGDWRTKKARLRGWPATIFLTTDVKYVEELATRSFTTTPEVTEEKILEANALTNRKVSVPWLYDAPTEAFQIITMLMQNLRNHCQTENLDIVPPFLNLYELFPKEIARDMRDFAHFTQLLKAITLPNYYQRPFLVTPETKQKLIVCSMADVQKAYSIYKEIFETTRTGTEKRILDFYHKVVKKKDAWYLKELTFKYNETAKRPLSEERIRVMMARLDEIGYVNTQKGDDLEDKRLNIYRPLMKGEKATTPLNLETWTDLEAKLRKGFEMWKNNILVGTQVYVNKNISETQWGEVQVSIDDLEKYVFKEVNTAADQTEISSRNQGETRIVDKPKTGLELEKQPSDKHVDEIRTDVDIPEGMIPCLECKAKGKRSFFATDADLTAHMRTWHEGR